MKRNQPDAPNESNDKKLGSALRWILSLLTLVVMEGIYIAWLSTSSRNAVQVRTGFQSVTKNLIRDKFPEVDFNLVYPGLTANEIDQLQMECLTLHYVYSPFVEFEPVPFAGKWVNILPHGFRKGKSAAPWPPAKKDVVVFVFGGSTTFGFGLPDGKTVVDFIEDALKQRFSGRTVRCYNFGRGYYFSSQERALFETLLIKGYVPNVAIFIDGVNDFVYYDGVPQLTPALRQFTAPDILIQQKRELTNDSEREEAVDEMINRYRRNLQLIENISKPYGVSAIFIGQPVPFLDFPMRASTYPFQSTFAEHKLASWGYDRFKEAGRKGLFGDRFVWCGNAFVDADKIMYVDSIHYSEAGAKSLAKIIVDRSSEVGLLP